MYGTEGKDYINAYSKSNLEIGRMLSNFYRCKIDTPDGIFYSVEGYYHYLKTVPCSAREELRFVSGYEALNTGRILKSMYGYSDIDFEDFGQRVLLACINKISLNKHLLLPKYKGIPIVHFYNYGGKIVEVPGCEWWVEGLNFIVKEFYNSIV